MILLKLISNKTRISALIAVILIFQLLVVALSPASAETQPSQPFSIKVSVLDAKTGIAKKAFYLGEPVAVVVTLTNQSGVSQIVPTSDQLQIGISLSGRIKGRDGTRFKATTLGGGVTYSTDPTGNVSYVSIAPRTTRSLRPGQSNVTRIPDLAWILNWEFDEGIFTFGASYNKSVQSQSVFRVVVDETKTIPALQQMAKGPDDSDKTMWARVWLKLITMPSISGRIAERSGKGVGGVRFMISGTETTNLKNISDGTYDLVQRIAGGSYTLTPKLIGYTFKPASRTISNLTGHVKKVDFVATPQ